MRFMMLIHHDEPALAAAPQKELWADYAAFNEALKKAGAGMSAGERLKPVVGGSQQGTARTREVVKEFGGCCPRQGPEAGPHTACRNHRNKPAQGRIVG